MDEQSSSQSHSQNHSQDDPFQGIELGFGTWAWGDRLMWGYGRNYALGDLRSAFESGLAAGVTFFDTAEVYGQGQSEIDPGPVLEGC